MLMRFDPFQELDRLVQQPWSSQLRTPAVPMDAYRHGETFVIHFDLPGVDQSSIDVQIERNVLTVRAERTWQPVEGDEVLVAERRHGQYTRQLFLGEGLDGDRIHATYENGVLTLTIPLSEQAKPRRIEVAATADKGAIDVGSSVT